MKTSLFPFVLDIDMHKALLEEQCLCQCHLEVAGSHVVAGCLGDRIWYGAGQQVDDIIAGCANKLQLLSHIFCFLPVARMGG